MLITVHKRSDTKAFTSSYLALDSSITSPIHSPIPIYIKNIPMCDESFSVYRLFLLLYYNDFVNITSFPKCCIALKN